jgi:hypothetical protein
VVRVIFTLLLVIGMFGAKAQTAATLDSLDEKVFLLNELEFFIDPTNSLSFEEISSARFSNQFVRRPTYQNKDYRSGESYWIRFSVDHIPTEKVWLIEFYDQTIDHIEAYVPKPDGTYEKKVMGDAFHFKSENLAIKILKFNYIHTKARFSIIISGFNHTSLPISA